MTSAVDILSNYGFVNAAPLVQACIDTDTPVWFGFAMVQHESWGQNIYGHDPGGACEGWGAVTQDNFQNSFLPIVLNGGQSNGVGPTQVTSNSFFIAEPNIAWWDPYVSSVRGFNFLKGFSNGTYNDDDLGYVGYRYNGSWNYSPGFISNCHALRSLLDGATFPSAGTNVSQPQEDDVSAQDVIDALQSDAGKNAVGMALLDASWANVDGQSSSLVYAISHLLTLCNNIEDHTVGARAGSGIVEAVCYALEAQRGKNAVGLAVLDAAYKDVDGQTANIVYSLAHIITILQNVEARVMGGIPNGSAPQDGSRLSTSGDVAAITDKVSSTVDNMDTSLTQFQSTMNSSMAGYSQQIAKTISALNVAVDALTHLPTVNSGTDSNNTSGTGTGSSGNTDSGGSTSGSSTTAGGYLSLQDILNMVSKAGK